MARSRSPGYPSVSLEAALAQAEKIYAQNRTNAISREAAAKSMGYSGPSGASDKMISNLAHYGLVSKAGKGELKVTSLAVDIIRPEDNLTRRIALGQAGHYPQLFSMLRDRFPDGHFSQTALKNVLSRFGFQEIAIPSASKAYTETCQFLQQEGAYESYDGTPPTAIESTPVDPREKETVAMEDVEPPRTGKSVQGSVFFGTDPSEANERIVYREEGAPGQYLKLVASGELDDYLLEAIEDFVKRQRKRLTRQGPVASSIHEENDGDPYK